MRATARLRERLVALRLLRTETDVLAFGEDKLTYEVPIVEVFVDRPAATPADTALIAPPWTTVPWPVLALAEEAVARNLAAFSSESARAKGVPWLDLVRDRALGPHLRTILDDLALQRHVPPALVGRVTPAEAEARWVALRAFHEASGHFLVTNGPYRLASWTDDTSVLQVFRDLSYPRGLGVFNSHALPLRAFVTGTENRPGEIVLKAEVERVDRFGRDYQIVREPFVKRVVEQDRREPAGRPLRRGGAGRRRGRHGHRGGERPRGLPRRPPRDSPTGPVRGARRAHGRRQSHQSAREGAPVDTLVIHILNSLFYASILFLIACGLTLVYGVMRIVNMAHGNLYALGAYVAAWIVGLLAGTFPPAALFLLLLVGRGGRRAGRCDPRADDAAAALPAGGGVPAPHHVRAPPDPRGRAPTPLGAASPHGQRALGRARQHQHPGRHLSRLQHLRHRDRRRRGGRPSGPSSTRPLRDHAPGDLPGHAHGGGAGGQRQARLRPGVRDRLLHGGPRGGGGHAHLRRRPGHGRRGAHPGLRRGGHRRPRLAGGGAGGRADRGRAPDVGITYFAEVELAVLYLIAAVVLFVRPAGLFGRA